MGMGLGDPEEIDGWLDGRMKGGRDGGREGGRDGWMDGGRDGGREGGLGWAGLQGEIGTPRREESQVRVGLVEGYRDVGRKEGRCSGSQRWLRGQSPHPCPLGFSLDPCPGRACHLP